MAKPHSLVSGYLGVCPLKLEIEKARLNRAIAAGAAACAADESVDIEACMRAAGYPRIETPACPHRASRRQLRNSDCWLGIVHVAAT